MSVLHRERGLRQRAALPLRRAVLAGTGSRPSRTSRAASACGPPGTPTRCPAGGCRRWPRRTTWPTSSTPPARPAQPKGIVVQHRPAANLIDWINRTFGVGAGGPAAVRHLALLRPVGLRHLRRAGRRRHVHVASEDGAARPGAAGADAARGAASRSGTRRPRRCVQLAPLFPVRAGHDHQPRCGVVMLSGDWIPVTLPDRVRAAFPGARVISLGGATEATVWSNWYPIGEVDPRGRASPTAGRSRTRATTCSTTGLNPCPIGVPGRPLHRRRLPLRGLPEPAGADRGAFIPDPFGRASRGRACTAPATGPATSRTATWSSSAASTSRSRSAASASSWGRSRWRWRRHPGRARGGGAGARGRAGRQAAGGLRRAVAAAGAGDRRAAGVPAADAARLHGPVRPSWPWRRCRSRANGKLDRSALPAPRELRADGSYVAPRNELERAIARGLARGAAARAASGSRRTSSRWGAARC